MNGSGDAIGKGARLSVCVVTFLPSPYQVELFNAISAAGEVSLRVVYLQEHRQDQPWLPVPCRHEHVFVRFGIATLRTAWDWIREADLTVFNYYTHLFALPALYARFVSEKPWAFWGERPDFLKLGRLGQWGRRLLLHPLAVSVAPIWAVGRLGLAGYRRDWGSGKTYVNFPYFSDLGRFSRARPTPDEATVTVLFSGVLNHRKGVVELARAFLDVAAGSRRLRLMILGSGPLEGVIQGILEPVSDRVTWHGFRQWHELPDFYAQADVLCLPTRHDGWGMVVPEALAAGLPVMATKAAGAAVDLVEHGVNGWLLPDNEVPTVAETLRRIASLPQEELARMKEAARHSVEPHSLEQGAERFAAAAREAFLLFGFRNTGTETLPSEPGQDPTSPVVIITGTYGPDRLSSMRRYVHLVQEAAEMAGCAVRQVDPPVVLGGRFPSRIGKLLAHIDKYVIYPTWLRWHACRAEHEGRRMLVHVSDQGMGIILFWLQDMPVVVTCHDLIAVRTALGELQGPARAWWQAQTLQHLIHRALCLPSWLMCVSEKTAADCQRLLGPAHRLRVVMNPLDPEFQRQGNGVRVEPGILPANFLLHVGNSLWYKNRPAVLRIYQELRQRLPEPPSLLMIGDPPTAAESHLTAELGIMPDVKWLARPPGEVIKLAYENAMALIFPSLEEGFGWPVLEAMACGCPVFASNRAPLTEVGGDVAEFFDPQEPAKAAQLIADRLALGEAWRSEKAIEGRRRAAGFSMAAFSEQIGAVYAEVLGCPVVRDRSAEAEPAPLPMIEPA